MTKRNDDAERTTTNDIYAENPQRSAYGSNPIPSGWHEIPPRRSHRLRVTSNRSSRHKVARGINYPVVAIALVLALMAMAGILTMTTSNLFSEMITNGIPTMLDADVPPSDASTPKEDWEVGVAPYLYQTDSQWSKHPYAGGTIGDSGCGPTCMTMAYVALTGKKDQDPRTMASFSESAGFVEDGKTTWLFMTEGARELGLNSKELPADAGRISSALAKGKPVVASMGPGQFTDTGHFILLCGVDEGGMWSIRDPNNPDYSHKRWNPDEIIPQARNFWALS